MMIAVAAAVLIAVLWALTVAYAGWRSAWQRSRRFSRAAEARPAIDEAVSVARSRPWSSTPFRTAPCWIRC